MAMLDPKKDRALPFRVPREGVAGWRKLYEVLGFILRKMGFKLSLDGIDGQEIDGGLHLRVDKSADETGNFICTAQTGGVVMTSGTILGITPKIGSIRLNTIPRPLLAMSGAGIHIVYAKITSTLSAAHNYVYTYTVLDVEILTGSTLPADVPASGTFYLQIASYSGATKTSQDITTSQGGEIDDDGSAASKGRLRHWPV